MGFFPSLEEEEEEEVEVGKKRSRREAKEIVFRSLFLFPLSFSAHARLLDEMRWPVAASRATTASNAILVSRGRRIGVRSKRIERQATTSSEV